MQVYDSLNDALIDCVKAAGGSKQVAPLLWPEKSIDESARLLCDCLNHDRNQKLSPDQAMFIMKVAKDKGCHIGIEHIASSLSYSIPTPIEPQDEMAELMKNFIQSQQNLTLLADRINKLSGMKFGAK